MPAELLELLRFGTAILAGGIVAVIAQRIAFRYARRLQREEREQRDAGIRRALRAEIDENIGALEANGRVALSRSAWEAARSLPFDNSVFDALAKAYRAADAYNIGNAIVNARWAGTQTNVLPLGASSGPVPGPALAAFEKARDALKPVG